MKTIAKYNQVEIIGYIEFKNWDMNGKSLLVSIVDNENLDEHIIVNNKNGKELLELVGKIVKATGTVFEDENGNFVISVKAYKVISKE